MTLQLRRDRGPSFSLSAPPALVPWSAVRFVRQRRFLWAKRWVLDLGGVTTINVKERAWQAVLSHISRPLRMPAA